VARITTNSSTPRSTTHIGTLVVCLPSEFEGGALVVRQGGEEVRFDWGQEATISTDFKWAFLFGDCEHEVKQVTDGLRLTIAYDLYVDLSVSTTDTVNTPGTNSSSTKDPSAIGAALRRALDDVKGFAPHGCTLAFGLKHSYPEEDGPFLENLADRLKGVDAVLLEGVRQNELSFSLKAAFPRPEYDDVDDPDEHARLMEQSLNMPVGLTRERNGLKKYKVWRYPPHDKTCSDI
jgi:hypothetical protein